MDHGKQLRQKAASLALFLGLAVILILTALLLQQRSKVPAEAGARHTGAHILMLLPTLEEGREDFRRRANELSDQYDLRIEIMDLATVSAQKQMLSIVPDTDVDAVLLWALTNIDEDYREELTACRQAGIPVVLIDHDFNDHTLRNSFVGGGINSELMVINQMILWTVENDASILIGSYSYADSSEIYELLRLEKGEASGFDLTQLQSARLKSFAAAPPDGYSPRECLRISGQQGTASLNLKLLETLWQEEQTGLIFSLDSTLTSALAASVDSGTLDKAAVGCIVGYGNQDKLDPYIRSGVIDELIVSDTLYSAYIGVRYLYDILRGFYVPDTLDSGVKLITR